MTSEFDVTAEHPLPDDPVWFSQVPAGQHYTLGAMAECLRNCGVVVTIPPIKASVSDEAVAAAMMAFNTCPHTLPNEDPETTEAEVRWHRAALTAALPFLHPSEGAVEK